MSFKSAIRCYNHFKPSIKANNRLLFGGDFSCANLLKSYIILFVNITRRMQKTIKSTLTKWSQRTKISSLAVAFLLLFLTLITLSASRIHFLYFCSRFSLQHFLVQLKCNKWFFSLLILSRVSLKYEIMFKIIYENYKLHAQSCWFLMLSFKWLE